MTRVVRGAPFRCCLYNVLMMLPESLPDNYPGEPEIDETGDIDLSLIDHNRSLSPAGRIQQHDRALAMVTAFREAGRRQRLAANQSQSAPVIS